MYNKHMGTIVVFRNVRIIVRTNDHAPPHIHAIRGDAEAKIEIESLEVCASKGFSKRDLQRIIEFMTTQEELLMEAWYAIHEKE